MAKPKKKAHTIKGTRGVRAKVWRNTNKNGAWFNVNIVRTYQDDDGDWQDSDSFSRDDLPPVVYVAMKAFDYIMNQNEEPEPEDEE